MRTLFPILCIVLFLCGCRSQSKLDSGDFDKLAPRRLFHSQKQSGDFGAFFVHEVAHYGGHTITLVLSQH